jgi:hypothetical protein
LLRLSRVVEAKLRRTKIAASDDLFAEVGATIRHASVKLKGFRKADRAPT